jgi:hypothetical protein
MIAHADSLSPRPKPEWHSRFLKMLPTIKRYARKSFQDFDPEAREEMIEECVANCYCAYARLVERGKEHVAFATKLANFAVRQIKDGRRVGKKQNVRDVYDIHARVKGTYHLTHIGSPRDQRTGWREQLVDNRRTPVPEQAAFRIDFPCWLRTLSRRDRRSVNQLAAGERTGDVARRFGVSAGRVSQLRRQLKESWEGFIGENGEVAAA